METPDSEAPKKNDPEPTTPGGSLGDGGKPEVSTVRTVAKNLRKLIQRPPVGKANLGDLRSTTPFSRAWGFHRGEPIDRYYIEKFMSEHRDSIAGACLEIGDTRYIDQFKNDAIQSIDVLHCAEGYPSVTIVGDLVDAPHIEADQFDCIICTQTLQYVSNPLAAVETMRRILRPGGVILITVPCISQRDQDAGSDWVDKWRFTTAGMQDLLSGCFDVGDKVNIGSYGNVLSAVAFLHGMSHDEFTQEELETHDDMFELIVTAAIRKT